MNLNREIKDDTTIFYSGDKKVFWFKEESDDSSVSIFVGGELLSETIHDFQDEIAALISVGMDVIIDFKEVTYIAVSYMKALLKIQMSIDKKGRGSVKLINIPQQILVELDKTGITELLWIE